MNRPDLAPTVFETVNPVLAVRNLQEALAYYADALGFRVAWTWGDPAVRAGVARDGVELQLVADGRFAPAGPSHVYVNLAGVDRYHAECVERGAEIT
ncbi:MAG TPA: glyoxalase superfamily protein, partial [Longimicrobiaceae bacterium]|nr:glyoxalase superfamily protein [Longimicrobiaceae bacterium]